MSKPYLNVQEIFGHDRRAFVDGLARAVENSSQHVLRDRGLENIAGELASCLLGIDAMSSFENLLKTRLAISLAHYPSTGSNSYLNDSFGSSDLQHLTRPQGVVRQSEVDDLGKFGKLDIVQDDQGTIDTRDSSGRKSELELGSVELLCYLHTYM